MYVSLQEDGKDGVRLDVAREAFEGFNGNPPPAWRYIEKGTQEGGGTPVSRQEASGTAHFVQTCSSIGDSPQTQLHLISVKMCTMYHARGLKYIYNSP